MVIIGDVQAKLYLFSYEKLFDAKTKTETDIRDEQKGKDNI